MVSADWDLRSSSDNEGSNVFGSMGLTLRSTARGETNKKETYHNLKVHHKIQEQYFRVSSEI